MSTFDLLTQLADTAQLQDGDKAYLYLMMAPGYRLRVKHSSSPGLSITSESLNVFPSSSRGEARWASKQNRLAILPMPGRSWAREPEERWTQVQAVLREQAGRPAALQRLLMALCLPLITDLDQEGVITVTHTGPARLILGRQRHSIPHTERLYPLAQRTVQHFKGKFVPWKHAVFHIKTPSTQHARLHAIHVHGDGMAEMARLEAAWLGEPVARPRRGA